MARTLACWPQPGVSLVTTDALSANHLQGVVVVRINLNPGPEQKPITKARIKAMLELRPRRMKLAKEWPKALHEPKSEGDDWNLLLPFCETLRNAFTSCHVSHIGLHLTKTGDRCYTFLRGADDKALEVVREWLSTVGQFVALRDCMALSFALDYDRKDGNPNNAQTAIGKLRTRAKPYDKEPTRDTLAAADDLVKACFEFLEAMPCYETVDAVLAMPPSSPDKPFDLPTHLAAGIAKARGLADCCKAVTTLKARPALKDTAIATKLGALEGTVGVKPSSIRGKTVLLIDDLYQSGTSVNYVAMLLLEAGASKVFGLTCEKTCRNDDNVSSSGK